MLKKILGILILSTPVFAQTPDIIRNVSHAYDSCSYLAHGGYGKLPSTFNNTPLCNTAYFVEHNNDCKIPFYALERFGDVHGDVKRQNDFRTDPRLDKKHASTLADYERSGYDRGHISAADNYDNNSVALSETFYMSNMAPQIPEHNRKQWRILESKVKKAGKTHGDIVVITGTVIEDWNDIKTIGNGVCVPTHFFKIVLKPATNTYVAWISPNKVLDRRISSFDMVELEVIEKKTGINFFPDITPTYDADLVNLR